MNTGHINNTTPYGVERVLESEDLGIWGRERVISMGNQSPICTEGLMLCETFTPDRQEVIWLVAHGPALPSPCP